LIEKHGLDVKMACHGMRILRSGREFLETGILQVDRPDKNELMDIRNGKYKLHELAVLGQKDGKLSVVDGLFAEEFNLFYKALNETKLPSKPNLEKINNLLEEIQYECCEIK